MIRRRRPQVADVGPAVRRGSSEDLARWLDAQTSLGRRQRRRDALKRWLRALGLVGAIVAWGLTCVALGLFLATS